jgi:hypothetical protein
MVIPPFRRIRQPHRSHLKSRLSLRKARTCAKEREQRHPSHKSSFCVNPAAAPGSAIAMATITTTLVTEKDRD